MHAICFQVGVAIGLAATVSMTGLRAQTPEAPLPWFGVTRPPGITPHTLEVLGARPVAPVVIPSAEQEDRELAGARIRVDLETVVGFSKESRASKEIGAGQMWGRVTGFPSGNLTVEWAVDQFRVAGITEVELQAFSQDADAALWLPLSWEMRLVGDPLFGDGSTDVVLESAMPLSAGDLSQDALRVSLVHVGMASPAELAHVDVRGKVAVQRVVPQGHTVFVRDPVGPRSEDLLDRGARAVLRVIDLPGNLRVRDIGCGGGTCFNLGGRDGRFVESVMNAATEAGVLDALQVEMHLESRSFSGLSGANGVAVIPGTARRDEYIVLNAHTDAWFDGAGDNGDGLAILVALARHFAQPDRRPERSLVFVASAGHHTPGLNGPAHFVSMNPDIAAATVLVVNLEHTAQRHIAPARSFHEDGYRQWTMDAREAPIVAGVSNLASFYEEVVRAGIARYGTNFVAGANPMSSGEGGPYRRAGLPVFTAMQGSPMYHTTGEVVDMVSTPGLERMARFTAFLVNEVGRAGRGPRDP
ncbi:MAG: M28 family peptidase [Acidobacteriota bacterium]|nr:M28 family peptidase [Acidobacteriota bacterium]